MNDMNNMNDAKKRNKKRKERNKKKRKENKKNRNRNKKNRNKKNRDKKNREEPLENTVYIFTDGACSRNPGPGGYGSILYFSDGKVKELGGAFSNTTNNQMEMMAILESLKVLTKEEPTNIRVYTDSMYCINGITKWMFGWKRNNWKTREEKNVLNKNLWQSIDLMLSKLSEPSEFSTVQSTVKWFHVPAHSNFMPNERVDQIAVAFSKNKHFTLYQGDYKNYNVDLFKDIKKVEDGNFKKSFSNSFSNSNKGKKAYSYVSRVYGVVQVHKTWSECEARVKGQSGVKFRKALSANEEKKLIKDFGG